MFTYRSLTRDDLEAAGRLLVEAYPHREDEPSRWRSPPRRDSPRHWGAFEPSLHGDGSAQLAGYAALWTVHGARFRFDVVVPRASERRGIGTRLFELVLDEASRGGADTLQARAYDTSAPALAFLARRRFVETMRMRWFLLDLRTADIARIEGAVCRVDDLSIEHATRDRMSDRGFWSALAELHDAAQDGWPDPDPGGPIVPIEADTLRSRLMPGGAPPVALVVAESNGQFIGYSALIRDRPPADAHFAATAVRPGARCRGVATALRARCLVAACAAGCTSIRSASGSAAIVAINARFGFEQRCCEVRLVRRLR